MCICTYLQNKYTLNSVYFNAYSYVYITESKTSLNDISGSIDCNNGPENIYYGIVVYNYMEEFTMNKLKFMIIGCENLLLQCSRC